MISKRGFFFLLLFSIAVAFAISFLFSSFFRSSDNNIATLEKYRKVTKTSQDDTEDTISNLKNVNPISRREAIVSLGKNKATEAIMPLFSLLMEPLTTDVEVELIAVSLYQITNGKIVSYAVQLLSLNYEKKTTTSNPDREKLTIRQTINLLQVLMQMTKEQMEKEKYNLDFLAKLLAINNNDLILKTLNCISTLSYEPLYFKIQGLYSQNLFLKIPVIQTVTRIALNYEKYKQNAMNFILKQISQETHPNVQEENYLALYMLTQHLLELSPSTENLVKKIVGLNSNSFDFSLQQEKFLLTKAFEEEQISLVQFFLSDFISVRLKSRLLNILFAQKEISFLDKDWLNKNIQRRNMDASGSTEYLDLAKISSLILARLATTKEEIRNILNYITDKKMTFTIVSAINNIVKNKTALSLLNDYLGVMKNAIYIDDSLLSWFSYISYTLKGTGDLKHILDGQSEKNQMQILHDLSGCNIPQNTRKELVETYGMRSQNPFFQTVLDEMIQGGNTCYFG